MLAVLALTDKEIEAGETVPIEEIMKEFGVEAKRLKLGKWKEGKDDKTREKTSFKDQLAASR